MSVIVELSVFPLDKGDSVSQYVAEVIQIIKDSGLDYRFGPMSTCIEGEFEEVMLVVQNCFKALKTESERIYMNFKADYRKGQKQRLNAKVESVLARID